MRPRRIFSSSGSSNPIRGLNGQRRAHGPQLLPPPRVPSLRQDKLYVWEIRVWIALHAAGQGRRAAGPPQVLPAPIQRCSRPL